MVPHRLRVLMFLAFGAPAILVAGPSKACVTATEAIQMVDKDVCIAAHIYDVVQVSDRTTYLDICTPDTPDAQCKFTIVSLWEDHQEVGELRKYRDMDVHIRGIVRPMHGRSGMILSHARQFTGGPPKFRPNPRLIRGFNGGESKSPISDPNLRSQGGHRAFMDARERETLPGR
jgi:hypothetical protein